MKTKYEASAEAKPKELCRKRRHLKEGPGECQECRRERRNRPPRAKAPGEGRTNTGGSRLDEDDIRKIRRSVSERGMPVYLLAQSYGLHEDSIRRIVRGATWGWVK